MFILYQLLYTNVWLRLNIFPWVCINEQDEYNMSTRLIILIKLVSKF